MALEQMREKPISALRQFVSERLDDAELLTFCPAYGGPTLIRQFLCSESASRGLLAGLISGLIPAAIVLTYLPRYVVVVCPDKIALLGWRGGIGAWFQFGTDYTRSWNGEVQVLPFGDIKSLSLRNSFLLGTRIAIETEQAKWDLGVLSPALGLGPLFIPSPGWKWRDFTAALHEVLSDARPDLTGAVEAA